MRCASRVKEFLVFDPFDPSPGKNSHNPATVGPKFKNFLFSWTPFFAPSPIQTILKHLFIS